MIWTRRAAPLALTLALLGSGCSAILNWDMADLPCLGDNQECAGGFSCLEHQCVRDGAQALDASCVRDRQCEHGGLCPNGKCAMACPREQAYTASSCTAGHYCAAFVSNANYTGDPTEAPQPDVVGACVTGSPCTSGAACSDAGAAVDAGICTVINGIGNGLNACVVGCDVTVATDGSSSNNCGISTFKRYCTPVGAYNYAQLACVTTGALGINVKGDGQACETVAEPCDPALGCMKGFCRRYCTPNTGQSTTCAPTEQCCTYSLALTHLGLNQDPTGYCLNSNISCPQTTSP